MDIDFGINVSEKDMDRFWRYVKRGEDCWQWQGCKDKFGYGLMSIKRKPFKTHRLSWMLHFGKIPVGMLVCHKCDNPQCVNPEHLWLGTRADNIRDMYIKGRDVQLVGERNGSAKLTRKEIDEIRSLYPKYRQPFLAQLFHVHQSTISDIVRGVHWK